MVGAVLDPLGAGLLTTAVATLNWHDQARYCARDGSPTHPAQAGWHRHCAAAGHEEYPRTDPAVICLCARRRRRVLLARQRCAPRRSVLGAGRIRRGRESLEACVVREIHEEVGVPSGTCSTWAARPGRFPRSLMVGFAALADPTSRWSGGR
jgi:NAD+ diphosphatase